MAHTASAMTTRHYESNWSPSWLQNGCSPAPVTTVQTGLWPHLHEPGLGQVSPEDGLDDSDGLLLRWAVFRQGDGAWDTGCGRALQLMTEETCLGPPCCPDAVSRPRGVGLPISSCSHFQAWDFKANPGRDMSEGSVLGCPHRWMGGATGVICPARKASGRSRA